MDLRTDLVVRHHGKPPGEAPTLLFLHGLTDSGAGWPEAVEHWGNDYSIFAVDQRGHGESPRFTQEQLDSHPGEVMVADVIALLEQLGEAPVVMGHSLGGAVALAAAVRRPDLVRALVLEDPAPLGPDDRQQDASRGEEFLAGLRSSLDAGSDDALLASRKAQHPDWPESELLVTGRAEQQMDLDYLAHGDFKPTTPWTELFPELLVATLVVTGDAMDEVCIVADIEKFLDELENGNVTVVRVRGAGHCIRREQPQKYYALVDDWLRTR